MMTDTIKKLLSGDSVTHELLANTMPFYCCWLPDASDPTKPCYSSVAAATALYSTQIHSMIPPKVWAN